jgi:hypothetical protein
MVEGSILLSSIEHVELILLRKLGLVVQTFLNKVYCAKAIAFQRKPGIFLLQQFCCFEKLVVLL